MSHKTGFARHSPDIEEIAPVLKQLPYDALIAGWPKLMNDIPYLAGKPVLLSHETHLPYHKAYADTMRARMIALLQALYAPGILSLQHLARDFGVTHLLVYKPYIRNPPFYFMPFDSAILGIRTHPDMQNAPRIVETLCRDSAIHETESLCLLDLRTLTDTP